MVRTAIFFSLALFLMVLSPPSAGAQVRTVDIVVGDRVISDRGLVSKGVVYVPVRPVAAALGVPCKWVPARKRLVINGRTVTGKAIRYNNMIYVAYTAVAGCSGMPVIFDGASGRVVFNPPTDADGVVSYVGMGAAPKVSRPSGTVPVRGSVAPSKRVQQPPAAGFINEPFIPVVGENDVFKVAVTNLENTDKVKAQSVSKPGNKFVVVHLSQQNVSNEVQIYTGKFALMDNTKRIYEYSEGLSNFWLVVLRPGGSNFGYIVFEVPQNAEPSKIILSTTSRPPLVLGLR